MSDKKSHWPTKAVMSQIYAKHFWGGENYDFYSGEGSHKKEIISSYISTVQEFLKSHNLNLTVCDLGCGDFNIGKNFYNYTSKYYAIDIVDNLITRNKQNYKADNLEFHCLDIAKDNIPQCDCIIIRQVFQHLSNTEILQILDNIKGCNYLIVTEHIPANTFIANKDKITNLGIRLKNNSGVDLLKPPFSIKPKTSFTLNTYYLKDNKSVIQTMLYSF